MFARPRLLPAVVIAALALFGLKLERIVEHGMAVWGVGAAVAKAKDGEDQAEKPAEAGKAAVTTAAKRGETAADKDAGKDAGKADAKAGDGAGGEQDTAAATAATPARPQRDFTPAELEVLEQLTKRREQIDARMTELDLRESVLAATEKRIDEKIERLKQLEAQIQGLLKQHDEESERQLKSLVKVYEAMKPKDAARILEQLEMDILLDVTERMREAKMAAVLAAMDAGKAKALTVELARRRQLPETGG